MLIDEANIYVRSGKGGDGMVHFHREKYVPRGGPDGGDGGRGASVYLKVVPTLNTLSPFRHTSRYLGRDGGKGGPNNMSGKSSTDLYVPVPPGTIVYDADTGEIMGDLVEAGQELLVGKGGRGGKGNQHYATSRNQAPRTAEKGEPAQERKLRLELKLIADVGIIGVPNAGKSSFLAAMTHAKPKIGDYPFTTLEPNLGVVELDQDQSLVLADIPGLIEGAHEGAGLGDAFLRHIQRTRVLIHLLDGLAEDPLADYTQINSELALFDDRLAQKPQLVAVNKIDLPEVQERWRELQLAFLGRGVEVVAVSALTRSGLMSLLFKAMEIIQNLPEDEKIVELPVYRPREDISQYHIKRQSDGWHVNGVGIERAAAMTYWEYDGSVRRFQRLMEKIGLDKALRQAGVIEGDSVFIGEHELEWQD